MRVSVGPLPKLPQRTASCARRGEPLPMRGYRLICRGAPLPTCAGSFPCSTARLQPCPAACSPWPCHGQQAWMPACARQPCSCLPCRACRQRPPWRELARACRPWRSPSTWSQPMSFLHRRSFSRPALSPDWPAPVSGSPWSDWWPTYAPGRLSPQLSSSPTSLQAWLPGSNPVFAPTCRPWPPVQQSTWPASPRDQIRWIFLSSALCQGSNDHCSSPYLHHHAFGRGGRVL